MQSRGWMIALVVGWPGLVAAQSPPLWGKRSPGGHAVGFMSSWQLDYARRYNTTFDDKTTYATGKAPRPILVNLWYPASKVAGAKRMLHRDYLDIRSDNPLLAKFAIKLADYNRGVIAREVLGKPLAELTDRERTLLDQGKTQDAIAFRDYYRESGLNCESVFLKVGKYYHGLGITKVARVYYKRVLLEPGKREAADKLKELGEQSRDAASR